MPELSIVSKPFPEPEQDPQRPGEYILAEALFKIGDQLAEAIRLGQLTILLEAPLFETPLRLQPHNQTVLLGLGRKPDELVITLGTDLHSMVEAFGKNGNPYLAFGLGAAWASVSRDSNQQGE